MIRFFDILFSFMALVVFLPFFLIVSIVLLITGEHQVFYLQKRVGKNGKLFKVFKFVTMLKNSEKMEGGEITRENDSRVLPFGVFLRKSKINELPQLLNILIGDMSVVGHRPLVVSQFEMYSEDVRNKLVTIKPGLTGIGSIVFRDEEHMMSFSELGYDECFEKVITPYKGQLEVWYTDNRTLGTYFKVIILTAVVILKPSVSLIKKSFHNLPVPGTKLQELMEKAETMGSLKKEKESV